MLAQAAEEQKAGGDCVARQFDFGGQRLCPTALLRPSVYFRVSRHLPTINKGRTETGREITKRAVVVDAEFNETNKTTRSSEWRGVLKKS